ncbi:transmembrane gamma-carboxyglutamic acid 1 [Pelobates cultripes]|uniref:Transmembrane gamma-carboxyglutamic acid 1 n=1 Tax=Pelobates cultripes TaxID=61616 RepID=A0AAD1VKS8_PELCU|nr:transmembrane gamma-carboxyglutamic acid 1 [Pelobates cultripes]
MDNMSSVFLTEEEAHSILKRYPRANSFLEEIKQGNIERECREEVCSYEEAREAFENDEKTDAFWKEYTKAHQGEVNSDGNWYPFYLAFPLIIVFFIILVVLFLVWRCISKKKASRQSAYIPRGVRENAAEVGIDPDGTSGHHLQHHSTVMCSLETAADRAGHLGGFIDYDVHSDTLSAGLSNCDPPPSYEEATGEQGARIIGPSQNPTEPPPHYEDIVSSAVTVPQAVNAVK